MSNPWCEKGAEAVDTGGGTHLVNVPVKCRGSFAFPNYDSVGKPRISPGRRLVRLEKNPEEDFGARLGRVGDRLFVVFVWEYPASSMGYVISGCRGVHFPRSAAYRIGLKFGDEILAINHISVGSLGVRGAEDYLRTQCSLLVEISETPLEQLHIIDPKNLPENLLSSIAGLADEDDQRSSGNLLGLEKGQNVVSVNGQSVLGMSDSYVMALLERSIEEGSPFEVSTFPTRTYLRLLNGINTHVAVLQCCCSLSSLTAAALVDCDFEIGSIERTIRRRQKRNGASGADLDSRQCTTLGGEGCCEKSKMQRLRRVWSSGNGTKLLFRIQKTFTLLQGPRSYKTPSLELANVFSLL